VRFGCDGPHILQKKEIVPFCLRCAIPRFDHSWRAWERLLFLTAVSACSRKELSEYQSQRIHANGILEPMVKWADLELNAVAYATLDTAKGACNVHAGSMCKPHGTAARVLRPVCYREIDVRGLRSILYVPLRKA
jgi:hypothetical protein